MLDQDFCTHLEYTIGNALDITRNEATKGFWCDGVLLSEPDIHYSKKFVNDNRFLKLTTWIGKGKHSQTTYEVYLLMGPKALSRYARDLSILECIPDTSEINWFSIDVHKKQIEIQLF